MSSVDAQSVTLELEVDGASSNETTLFREGRWVGEGSFESISVTLGSREEGHGFGLSEVVSVVVVIGVGVASNLAADAVRAAVGRVIHSVRGRRQIGDGSPDGLRGVIEADREDE
jgi:hypothetical protein